MALWPKEEYNSSPGVQVSRLMVSWQLSVVGSLAVCAELSNETSRLMKPKNFFKENYFGKSIGYGGDTNREYFHKNKVLWKRKMSLSYY